MRLQIVPVSAADDCVHCGCADSKLACQFFLCDPALRVQLSYGEHLQSGQPRSGMVFSPTLPQPALLGGILAVFFLGGFEKVEGIAAGRIVTVMTNAVRSDKVSKVKIEDDAVCQVPFPINLDTSISLGCFAALPRPAIIGAPSFYFVQDSLDDVERLSKFEDFRGSSKLAGFASSHEKEVVPTL